MGDAWPAELSEEHFDLIHWASDYAAPTPSFPVTPQAQRDQARQAQAAQHQSQRAAVVLQCLCRSHMARAKVIALRSDSVPAKAAAVDAEAQAAHVAATLLQSICRAHLVQQLRAWFTASVARVPSHAMIGSKDSTGRVGGRHSDAPNTQRAVRQRKQSDRRKRSSGLDAEVSQLKTKLHEVSTHASQTDIGELTQRIRNLERQLGRGLGQPASAARTTRRRRPSRAHTRIDSSSSSLRVKARPTVATLMSTSAADVVMHDRTALGTQNRYAFGRSKSTGTLGSSGALEQFSAEWSHGSVDGWSQWLPRHRWFQGLASQLHALHSLADPLAGAEDETRSYIRDYVERELSYPHRTSGHRMDAGNAVESAAAHSAAWKPGSASISSQREFGAPPDLPRRVAPTVPTREHWVTRLSRVSADNLHGVAPDGSSPAAHLVHQQRLQVTLQQDVGGTTGFGIVLQCDPVSSLQDRRLQPPSNATVAAVTPGSDASAAGVVAGMAVLSVNGNHLRPDTSVGELNKIFEEIVGLHSVDFEFESKGSSTWPDASLGSLHGSQSSRRVSPKGWCARAQSLVSAAGLGKREAMIVVLWDGGGTARTAASSMCEHAAHQLADVLSKCFTSGLVRDVVCVATGTQATETSEREESAAAAVNMWSRPADDLLRRMVPEHTSPTGGRIAWSAIAAKLTGWSKTTSSSFMYSGRGCQERWEQALDPKLHQWSSLRPPRLSVWWCNGAGSGTDSDIIVPEQLYSRNSEPEDETTWPSEDEVVALVGARIHHHLEVTEQDTEHVVSALHKQVRQQMRSRRELHAEIDTWQAKNRELERKCAFLAAAQLAERESSGVAENIYAAIRSNPLRPCAAPSRQTTPAGAAAADFVPGLSETTIAMLPVTDVTTMPMPVLSVESPPEG